MMEENQQNILLSELCSVSNYLDRIFGVLSKITYKQELNIHLENLRDEIFSLIKINTLDNHDQIIEDIQNSIKYFKYFLKLPFDGDNKKELGPLFINTLYDYAHLLHLFCLDHGPIEIELPRVNILRYEEKGGIPRFFLPENSLEDTDHCPILILEDKRSKNYDEIIHQGHEAIYFKQILKAREYFLQAINLKETPEALTLLAWAQSQLGNPNEAKELCHRAIELDPEYGPPYNDLGICLMKEGLLEESLRWFEKAKKSIDYQNREFPYINSGRVYMNLKKYDKALNELQMALTLVPSHQMLHKTVERLKQTIPNLGLETK